MSLSRIHSRLLPKIGKYAGHEMPLTFSKFNTRDVVKNTRRPDFTTVFDVSHMGVYETKLNENSQKKIEKLLHIDLNKLYKNKAKLTVVINRKGEVLDDLIISNIQNRKLRLVVNAGAKTTDFFDNFDSNLHRKHQSVIALQGNGSQKLLEKIVNTSLSDLYFMENTVIVEDNFEICRCGYTGEDGFELYLNDKYAEEIYENLVNLAELHETTHTKVQFGGLIERDILRLEAGLSLAGAEFDENMGIKFEALNMPFLIDKKQRKILNSKKETSLSSNLFQSLLSSEKPLARGPIFSNTSETQSKEVGFLTSVVKSFNLNKFIGIGYLDKSLYGCDELKTIFTKDRRNRISYLEIHNQFIIPKYYRNKY